MKIHVSLMNRVCRAQTNPVGEAGRGPYFHVPVMLLVLDNYDSFTYNLVQYLGEMNVEMQVHRNDQITLDQIEALKPERILISPGPCSPREPGLSNEVIRQFAGRVPTLGVCLGHQCIGHTFGGEVVVNYRMMHGKTSMIRHNNKDLFKDMPNQIGRASCRERV